MTPASPMSPSTVEGTVSKLRRFLKDIGYLVETDKGSWAIAEGVDWTKLSIKDIERWKAERFPDPEPPQSVKYTHNNDMKMLRKLGEFLYWEYRPRGSPAWSRGKLYKLQQITVLLPTTTESIEINSPSRSHAFAQWLINHPDPLHQNYGRMVWTGQMLGLRYGEMVNLPMGLDEKGSLYISSQTGWIFIWGKGRHGKKERKLPLSKAMKGWLKDLVAWRGQQNIVALTGEEHGRMFFNQYGKPLNPKAQTMNHMLRKYAREYNETVGEKLQLDVKLVKTHALMRHVFGTYYGERLKAKKLMDYMGIEKFETVERYINYSDRSAVAEMDRINGDSPTEPIETPKAETSSEPSLSVNGTKGLLQELYEVFPTKPKKAEGWRMTVKGLELMMEEE